MSIPSIIELAGVFENPGAVLRYLVLHGVLELVEICSREACEGQMRVNNRLKPYLYRCWRKTCGMYVSVYNDSFFASEEESSSKSMNISSGSESITEDTELKVFGSKCRHTQSDHWRPFTPRDHCTHWSLERISRPIWHRNGAPDREQKQNTSLTH